MSRFIKMLFNCLIVKNILISEKFYKFLPELVIFRFYNRHHSELFAHLFIKFWIMNHQGQQYSDALGLLKFL